MNFKIYSIVYDAAHSAQYERYDNSHIKTPKQKSYLFEYNPIVDIVDNHSIEEEYLGIFSYKFATKFSLNGKAITKDLLRSRLENSPGFDVYGLSNLSSKMFFGFDFIERSHPGFFDIFFPLCDDLNLSKEQPEFMINSNFFVAKTEVYRDYVNSVIKPAIELLDGKYRNLAWRKCNYAAANQNIMQLTGLPCYTFHTFVLERLMAQYCRTKGLKIINLFN
jgi:hypothetical protein